MANILKLSDFVKTAELFHKDKFTSNNALDYLGKNLKNWLEELLSQLGVKEDPLILAKIPQTTFIKGRVYIAEDAIIEPTALIEGPCYIGAKAQVRHGAYIRGVAYVGPGAVVGHTTEVKGAVFMDGAKAGHFAYVGDSILGRKVNLGAGTKLANFKFKGNEIFYKDPSNDERCGSGLRKFGAIIGDECNLGCNSVTDPGSLMLPGTAVMPCSYFRGTLKNGIFRS